MSNAVTLYSQSFPHGGQPWTGWSLFPGPSASTAWSNAVLLPTDGSGGNIPFITFGGYTPAPYAAPSLNAPTPGANNAAPIGWNNSNVGSAALSVPVALAQGQQYTVSFWYAGNAAQASLTWYVTAALEMPSGTFIGGGRPDTGQNFQTTFDPTLGWQQYTFTFTADENVTAGAAILGIYGIGTNGSVNWGSTSLTSSTTIAPVLIADVTITFPTAGSRIFPPQARLVGTSLGYVPDAGDPRIPHLDSSLFTHPRQDKTRVVIPGSLTAFTVADGADPVITGAAQPAWITAVIATVETLSSGGSVDADVQVNGASIFSPPSSRPHITSTAVSQVSNVRYPAFYIPPASTALITVSVGAISGTATTLTVTYWTYYP